jgi:predicted protein tyrosine phosphatase
MEAPKTAAIVTSRLPRLIDPHDPWLSALRASVRRIHADQQLLAIGEKTAGVDLIRRAAERMKIGCFTVTTNSDGDETGAEIPVRDRALCEAADIVYALRIRSGGNLHRLLIERLTDQQRSVCLIDLPDLQIESVKAELLGLGAMLWTPCDSEFEPFSTPHDMRQSPGPAANDASTIVALVPFPAESEWTYLTHTTRAQPGPWPGQSFDHYADSLLDCSPDADHSALATLKRIIAQRIVFSSGHAIRGGYKVVSFTECPLSELPALHRFRPHRVRWDFGPFGICIQREWLIQHGARPAIYGDEAVWSSLTESDRPFFQLAAGTSGIDWKIEREWRVPADVKLDELTPTDVMIVVPDYSSAKPISKVTDWPITLWPEK